MESVTENQRLKQFRELIGKTQKDFAEIVRLKQGSYADVERGKVKVSGSIKLLLEKEYGLNLEWLTTGVGEVVVNKSQNKTQTGENTDLITALSALIAEKDMRIADKERELIERLKEKDELIEEVRESKELWKEKAQGYEKKISSDVPGVGTTKQPHAQSGREKR